MSRIKIRRVKLFNCCLRTPHWKADPHYNDLLEPSYWNFDFWIPPFSIGSRCVDTGCLELLCGNNVLLI
jgi:hypothetical protein